MKPQLFGLAEIDMETGEPDLTRVRHWGLETDDAAVVYWQSEDGQSQVIISESAEKIASRWGLIAELALVRP